METLEDVALDVQRLRDELLAFKARPRNEVSAELQLARKLTSIFDKAAAGVMSELLKRTRIPADAGSRAAILDAFVKAVPELANATVDDAVVAAQRGRNKIINDLRQGGRHLNFTDIPETIIGRVKESAFRASEQTMKRLVGQVKISLEQGFEEGLGTRDIAGLLEDQFTGMRDFELNRVARTEVQSFQNKGAQETMKELGVQYEKWVTSLDGRQRASHEDVHGEITAVDVPFSNGLRYPLDDSGPLEEWVNCRCRAVPFIVPHNKRAPSEGPFFENELLDVEE